jgi:tetratricopeptide (TPR) repeat protein
VGTLAKRRNARRRGHGRCVALPFALLVAVLGASALPAHAAAKLVVPDRHGVIHTCIGGDDGNELHVVNAGGPCPDHELALPWNWRGRPGPQGKPGGAESEPCSCLLFELLLADELEETHKKTGGSSVKEAASTAGDWFTLLGFGMLALALALSLARWVTGFPWRWAPLRRWRWVRSLGKLFGPALQIEAFEDGAMKARVGPSFALLTQARVDGGRETGSHLYLVTGEERTSDYLADLQGIPQTQVLAVALSLLRLLWRRPRLAVSGSLKPIDDLDTAAVTVSLRLDARLIDTSEFWLGEPPTPKLTPAASNRVLAVAVAGWIEHETIDETPGPPAREVLLSYDSRSWALFRAGSEMNRMSLLEEAADLYERALAIDHDNIGALIDLAHLRRLDGHYEGAKILALDAIGLVEQRNVTYGRRNEEDPNWYRAKIVLATTYAEWARDKAPESRPPKNASAASLQCALEVATRAMAAKDRLEYLVAPETLRDVAGRGKIGIWAYLKVPRRAHLRSAPSSTATSSAIEPSPDGRQSSPSAGSAIAAGLRRWRTFRRRSVELHALLETTFEPGALLLIASNQTTTAAPLARRLSEDRRRGESLPARRKRLRKRRGRVEEELDRSDLRRAVLIEYVKDLPFKNPRVVYNLACWFGREAGSESGKAASSYREKAFELLRQSISRTPPLERRALLSHAELDSDLESVRRAHGRAIAGLWRLVPADDARFRSLDRFMQEAGEWADREDQVQGIAVVGSWAQGDGGASDTVSIILITDAPDIFIGSDDWFGAFDRATLLRRWRTQSLYRPRIELPSGLMVEFLILTRDRIATDPAVRKLARDGHSILYEAPLGGETSLSELLEEAAGNP